MFVLVIISYILTLDILSVLGVSCDSHYISDSGSLLLPTWQLPLQNKMNPMETGTQIDLAEISHSRPRSYSALMNEILASPAEAPSPLLTSNDFRLPASAADWSMDQRFADLEARLFKRQEKISEILRLMTQA